MNDLIVKKVDLFGNTVVAAQDHDGMIWAGVSYVCNGLGLTKAQKDSQVEKVQKDVLLQQGCRKFPAGVLDGNNETVALKVDFVPLWLAKIAITPTMKENNPEMVEKLIKYQLRAKEILAEAFFPQQTTITYQYPLPASTFESVANMGRLIERVMKSEGACPFEIALVLKPIFQQAGIEIQDCFVKIPAYEQLALSFEHTEVITRQGGGKI